MYVRIVKLGGRGNGSVLDEKFDLLLMFCGEVDKCPSPLSHAGETLATAKYLHTL